MKHIESPPDPFRFGWRYVAQVGSDGRKRWVQVPLSLDDVLHPQEGDHIPENSQQERDRRYLASLLEMRLADKPDMLVLSDCMVDWGVPGLRNHAPDVSVFEGVNDPKRNWKTFSVAKEGARPILAIEIVSPDAHDKQARDNDAVTKVHEYYRAGVPLYLLVDQERDGAPRRLIVYRQGARKYVRLRADRRGRLLLAPLRLLVGLRDERVVCWDADSGEELGDLSALAQVRDAEAEARQIAEAERDAEAEARQIAEAERDAEAQARQIAEAERDAEAQARQIAEATLAEVEARLRELESQTRYKHGKRSPRGSDRT